MRLLLVVLLVVLVVVVVAIALRRAAQANRPAPSRPDPFATDPGRFDARRLKVGDVVSFDGRDHIVRGTLRMNQSGSSWAEHLLDDVRSRAWLSVEDDEGLVLCIWHRLPESTLEPGPPSLSYEGMQFRLSERGEATFLSEGTTGTAQSGHMEYVDYAAGPERLSFERFGSTTWEVSRGRVVGERELTIYPVTD